MADSRAPRLHHSDRRPFLPTLSRALLDGELIEGFPGAGRAAGARRGDDLRADPARGRGAGRRPARGERRRQRPFAADRAARRLRARRRRDLRRSRGGRCRRAPGRRRRSARSPEGTRWRCSSAPGARRCAARSAAPTRTGSHSTRSEPALVASTPAQAYALAGDLAALIDDMIIEGIDPRALDDARAGRALRPLLGHHARLPQDRLRRLAASGSPSTASSIERPACAPLVEAEIAGSRQRRAGRAGPDDHRGLDRRQPRHRPADRRHRPVAIGARSCCPASTRISTTAPGT